MSTSLQDHRIRAAQHVVEVYTLAQLRKVEAEKISRDVCAPQNAQAFQDALKRLRKALHTVYGKQSPRVGIGIETVCTLLELDQKDVQKFKNALGYDTKYPLAERYDYHQVRNFGVQGHGKAGHLVHILESGGVIVGTFLGTTAELETALQNGATLSLKKLPDLLASPWQNDTEREGWQTLLLETLTRVRKYRAERKQI